ncbi:sensor histidine kinase [Mesonia sp. K7]|uniref:sensor histidine kinase n=1 Tax=Mesonia sp. K7 TaxID=2218606 RepID=UPI000DA93EE0|nr:sensor histidine kinase [Mesonia sp. K7]PZD79627.1 hypothetical protein DNG35_01060 [Mesonia sp. K7]
MWRSYHKIIVLFLLAFNFGLELDTYTYFFQKKNLNHINQKAKADSLFSLAENYKGLNKNDIALANYEKAIKIYNSLKDQKNIAVCNYEIFWILNAEKKLRKEALPYLNDFYRYARDNSDTKLLLKAYNAFGSYYFARKTQLKSKNYFLKGKRIAEKNNDSVSVGAFAANLGLIYSGYIKKQDSARYYYQEALKNYKTPRDNEKIVTAYINIANSLEIDKDYNNALRHIQIADTIQDYDREVAYKKIIYQKYSTYYKNLGDVDNALKYYELYNQMRDSINRTEQNIAISEIQTKYETEKKEKENLILKTEVDRRKTTQKSMIIGFIVLAVLGAIFTYLFYKNLKRKQIIKEQQQEINLQNLERKLKNEEVNTINAMVTEQENERQRLAENLHDNLGSTLAALKLHTDNLKNKLDKENQADIEKSQVLLDDAYEKVRTISHQKNAGVMAKEGLVPAVKNLANSFSTNDLQIHVQDYLQDERIENQLEITLFRMIQELLANAIKHAQAHEINISLTHHENSLNIIVEDNGVGFTTNKNLKRNGIGLSTIDKRVEHLGGTLEIDSYPRRGTSIIINIPT